MSDPPPPQTTARITFPDTVTANITLYTKREKEATAYTATTLDDSDYTEADGAITLTSYKGSATAIRLPDEADALAAEDPRRRHFLRLARRWRTKRKSTAKAVLFRYLTV